MRKIFIVLTFVFSTQLFYSCDKIDDPYVPLPVKEWYGKKAFIEDYTGHKCPNCPDAAKQAAIIDSIYKGKVVIIAVHAGGFATPSPPTFPEDFRTDAGDTWNSFFGFQGYPIGMINRIGFPTNTHKISHTDWASKVGTVISQIPEVGVDIIPKFDTTTRKLSGDVKIKFLKTIKRKLKLQVLITEDSIVAPQKYLSGTITDYVHHHLLRGDVNGIWGEDLTNGLSNTEIDTEIIKTIKKDIPQDWRYNHCNIVVFVYDDKTKEILQAEEAPMK